MRGIQCLPTSGLFVQGTALTEDFTLSGGLYEILSGCSTWLKLYMSKFSDHRHWWFWLGKVYNSDGDV